MNKIIRLSILLILALVMILPYSSVSADNSKADKAVGEYTTENGTVVKIYPGIEGLKALPFHPGPVLMDKLFPMTPEAEAAIVYEARPRPVIIDGKTYEGNQISQFNGKRLYFVDGKDGKEYAFTTAVKVEQFLKEEYGLTFSNKVENESTVTPMSCTQSAFYNQNNYWGTPLMVTCGQSYSDLSTIGWNNCIRSISEGSTASYLYDDVNYSGYCVITPAWGHSNFLSPTGSSLIVL